MVGSRIPRGYSTVSDSTRIRNNAVYVGFIKENADAQRMGRLKVYIPELSSDPNDEASWILVSYASMFAGATNPENINSSSQTMTGSQQSYGWWAVPPDKNNQVLVCFVNGEISRGYWFACIWQQGMDHMIPGIACNVATTSTAGSTFLPPVVEYNKINQANPDNPARPPFTPLANGLVTEGLQGDPERGPSSTSARREAPSAVFGMLTPRGNTMHIDDNPNNEFIRFRTRSGTQILVDETTGMVYINSKLGNAWIEISDAGVDVYSANSVSIRAELDFNVRADRNIIFDAGTDILLKAGTDVNIQSGNNIVLGSSNQLILSSTNNTSLTVGANLNLSVTGNMATQATGNITESASGTIIRSAPQILDNSGTAPNVAPNPAAVPQPTSFPDIENGAATTLETIVSRMPTHEPWNGHPHIGVPLTPGEPYTNPGPQGPAGGATTQGSTTVQTGTGSTKVTAPIPSGCNTGVSTVPCSNAVWAAIQSASSQTGCNFGTMMAIAQVESGFNPGAGNPSGAQGLYQFVPSTWTGMVNQYGSQYNVGSGDILVAQSNALMGGQLANSNASTLGVSTSSAGPVYLAHMLGSTGASTLLNADPSTPLTSLAQPLQAYVIQDNPGWINGNEPAGGGGVNLGTNATVGQYVQNITAQMNGLAAKYDAQTGAAAPCSRTGAVTTPGTSGVTSGASTTGASTTGAPLSTNPNGTGTSNGGDQ